MWYSKINFDNIKLTKRYCGLEWLHDDGGLRVVTMERRHGKIKVEIDYVPEMVMVPYAADIVRRVNIELLTLKEKGFFTVSLRYAKDGAVEILYYSGEL
jgi:hypothetical protein